MIPSRLRLYSELSYEEGREDRQWYRQATPEERQRADDLLDLWYREKDEAAAFSKRMRALLAARSG